MSSQLVRHLELHHHIHALAQTELKPSLNFQSQEKKNKKNSSLTKAVKLELPN